MSSPSQPPKPKGTFGQWVANLFLRSIIKLALALPWRLRGWLIGNFTARFLAPLVGYKRRAIANLGYIYPEMGMAEKQRITRKVCDNAGRTLIEIYSFGELGKHVENTPVSGPGLAAIEEAHKAGRPVMLVTGHYGNFEAARMTLVNRGYEIGGLLRPMSNPYFNAHYVENMENLSGPAFFQGRKGTMQMLKYLRGGGKVMVLFDLYSSQGVPIDFLGKPAPTLTSLAEIAVKTNALIVPFFGKRLEDNLSFDVVVETPIEGTDPLEITKEMSARLEARVAQDPEQWLWIHRRWKPERQRKIAEAKTGP
jgi:KDO2-lipid IV(A) lauroyltransferase